MSKQADKLFFGIIMATISSTAAALGASAASTAKFKKGKKLQTNERSAQKLSLELTYDDILSHKVENSPRVVATAMMRQVSSSLGQVLAAQGWLH